LIEIQTLASGSKGNAYRIHDGRTSLLLECGIPWKRIQQELRFKTSDISGCLISHSHLDHCKSIKEVARAGINIYLSQGTKDEIGIQHHRVKPVDEKKQFQVGTWLVLPFGVEHDTSSPYGYLLANQAGEKLVFITDSFYCRYKFDGLTHVMIEANYSTDILQENISAGRVPPVMKKRLMRSHFSLEHVKDFLNSNDMQRVQEIWLLHLSDNNSDEERFKREIMELTGKVVYVA
jgi:phosphoribosyl 1,2-cyclic phosphodiesterase